VAAVKRISAAVLAFLAIFYGADYLSARWRGAAALGTVQVQPYYAVPLKDGKTEFMMLDPETRTCVKSVAPHFGYEPCWYLDGKKEQRIQM
jgi:hypothetical protein